MLTVVNWKLRQIMADKMISNKQLADAVGVHENTISRWRQSNEMPRVSGKELDLICSALGCELSDLVWRSKK